MPYNIKPGSLEWMAFSRSPMSDQDAIKYGIQPRWPQQAPTPAGTGFHYSDPITAPAPKRLSAEEVQAGWGGTRGSTGISGTQVGGTPIQEYQDQYPSDYGGEGFGYSTPPFQTAPPPQLPTEYPKSTVDFSSLPQTPNYYTGLNLAIADPYASLQPGAAEAARLEAASTRIMQAVTGAVTLTPEEMAEFGITGTPTINDVLRVRKMASQATSDAQIFGGDQWGDAQTQLNQAVEGRKDYFGHLDPKLVDHYSGIDTRITDRYGNISGLDYQHYLGLDPSSPDYFSGLKAMIDSGNLSYEQLSEEDQMTLSQQYADIQIDPQSAAVQRMLEQAELDAQKAENRVHSAFAGVPEHLERRESAQAARDLESAVARGAGTSGAVEWKGAQRDEFYTEQLTESERRKQTEIMNIADQLGLTQRQAQERLVQLEELRGKLTATELDRISQREYERAAHGYQWEFEASLAIADRLTDAHRWEHDQARYVADRLTQIDQFNAEQQMGIADRRTALDQWMVQMDMSKADRLTALEQWEKSYDMEIAHRTALEDANFREWEFNARMQLGDREYDKSLQEFNARMGLADRTYAQAADQFARELQIADRLTQHDIDQMSRALDVFDRTQLSTAQQYTLWVSMAEVAGIFPAKLPG